MSHIQESEEQLETGPQGEETQSFEFDLEQSVSGTEMTGEKTTTQDGKQDKPKNKEEAGVRQHGFDRATLLSRYAELGRARKALTSHNQNIEHLRDSGVFHSPYKSSQSAKDLDPGKKTHKDMATEDTSGMNMEINTDSQVEKMKAESDLILSETLNISKNQKEGSDKGSFSKGELKEGVGAGTGKNASAMEDENGIVILSSMDDNSKLQRCGARKKRVNKWCRSPAPCDDNEPHPRKCSTGRHFHNTRSEHDRLSRVGAASTTKDEIVTIHRTLSSDAILQHCEHSIVTNGSKVRRRNTQVVQDDKKSTTSSRSDGNHSDSYDTCDTCDEYENCDLSETSSVSSTFTELVRRMHTDEIDNNNPLPNYVEDMDIPAAGENETQRMYNVGERSFALCEICFDWRDLNLRFCCNFPACDDCVSQYFITQVNQGIVKIECLNPACTQNAHKNEILARFLNLPEMQEKFHRFLVEANKDPHIKTCPRCSQVLKIEPPLLKSQTYRKKGHQVKCSECKLIWCFPCQAPWHDGLMCTEYRRGDKLLRRWAKEHHYGQANAQKCPRCKVYIQRSTGCDHMQCSRCKTSFCYRCGDRYREVKFLGDHFSKFSIFGCKYRFKPDQPVQRKLIRGAVFSGQLVAAPIVGAIAVAMGIVMLGISVVILPCYGGVKIHKKLEARKQRKRRRQAAAEWRAKLESIHKSGDPYLENWLRLRQQMLLDNPDRRFLYERPAMLAGPDIASLHCYMDLVHGYKVSNIASGSASSSTSSCSSEDDGQVKVTEVKVITEAPPSDMKVTDDEIPPDAIDMPNCDSKDKVRVNEIRVSCGSVELHSNPHSDRSIQDGAASVASPTTAAKAVKNSDIHLCYSKDGSSGESNSKDGSSPKCCRLNEHGDSGCQNNESVADCTSKVDCDVEIDRREKCKKHSSMEELYQPGAESVRAQSDVCWYFTV